MGWNYRVLVTMDGDDHSFDIHEVHYNEHGLPCGHTKRGATVGSYHIDGIEDVLERMNEALEKPILWGDDKFPEQFEEE